MEPFWGNNMVERADFFMWLEDNGEINAWDDLLDAIYNERFSNISHWLKLEGIKDEIINRYRDNRKELLKILRNE